MMTPLRAALLGLIVALAVAGAGCGGDDDEAGATGSDESYAEGRVRMEIEFLDTGLLKGHSYADASDGYKVTAMKVEAVDHRGASWNVLEPEKIGLDSASATEFFEAVIQEIPRGEQLTLTTTATFADESGATVERTAVDSWPP